MPSVRHISMFLRRDSFSMVACSGNEDQEGGGDLGGGRRGISTSLAHLTRNHTCLSTTAEVLPLNRIRACSS